MSRASFTDLNHLISLPEAAKIFSYTEAEIEQFLATGVVRAHERNGVAAVDRDELKRYQLEQKAQHRKQWSASVTNKKHALVGPMVQAMQREQTAQGRNVLMAIGLTAVVLACVGLLFVTVFGGYVAYGSWSGLGVAMVSVAQDGVASSYQVVLKISNF